MTGKTIGYSVDQGAPLQNTLGQHTVRSPSVVHVSGQPCQRRISKQLANLPRLAQQHLRELFMKNFNRQLKIETDAGELETQVPL